MSSKQKQWTCECTACKVPLAVRDATAFSHGIVALYRLSGERRGSATGRGGGDRRYAEGVASRAPMSRPGGR